MRISNGLWNWFSRGIGGRNAVDYLIKVEGYTFKEAIEIIIDKTKIQRSLGYENNKEDKKKYNLVLPQKSENYNKTKAYLMSRGIDKEIIEECIKNNLIYEEKNYHNVVFVGYDKNQNAKYAFYRATNKQNVKLPSIIKKYLEENQDIIEIHLHLDNDEVGRCATENLRLYKIYFAKKFDGVGERGSQEKSHYKNNYFEKNI